MNEEEKKAVVLLKALNNLEKKCKIEEVPYKSEIKKIRISLLPEDYGIFKIILNLIEKLQKENEEFKRLHIQDNKHLDFIMKHSISIQKVKDKIEEEKLPLTIVGGRKNKKTLEYGIKLGRRQALQELIEEREKNEI